MHYILTISNSEVGNCTTKGKDTHLATMKGKLRLAGEIADIFGKNRLHDVVTHGLSCPRITK